LNGGPPRLPSDARGSAAAGKGTRHAALWLSAVMPGLGQFAQRRLAAGVIYLVGFLAPFGVVLVLVCRALYQTMRAAMAFAAGEPDLPFVAAPIGLVIALSAAGLLVYGISLADTWLAEKAQEKRRRGV
jgi:hypothetical protein